MNCHVQTISHQACCYFEYQSWQRWCQDGKGGLSEQPEVVLVAERTAQGGTLRRLDADRLKPWLEKYRLVKMKFR